ncbi:5-amino-6-(5-phosphoribosylamino)uracil reductase [Azorhizobium oxalatiphilum]|uniref:5-amino-6-(5-phosphoribosylamino)uracil reductase n=1 Tax=Azorhizobium oxalatiphilum TaxID=980631 RepID=A0A917BJN9_9HYPH|nr:RibD family protein [Azorhizobium oxalatiphilum]GGF46598.1 5-amino-6-(5-phosphoribosylamino)uracil reductase [Azorhizobium oxalatiphilum]
MDDHRTDLGTILGELNALPTFVVGQLGQSLDGRVALPSGESKYISGPKALDHVHHLRAMVDAVLVGIGTVEADDPLLTVRRVPGRNPARVVLDPSGRLSPSARVLTENGARRLVIRRPAAGAVLPAGVETLALESSGGLIQPAEILEALRAEGLNRILVEGGPRTLSAFLDAGALDLFHIVVSPVILGTGRTGLDLAPIACLGKATRPATRVHVFPEGDVLFACDLRQGAHGEGAHGNAESENDGDKTVGESPAGHICPAG